MVGTDQPGGLPSDSACASSQAALKRACHVRSAARCGSDGGRLADRSISRRILRIAAKPMRKSRLSGNIVGRDKIVGAPSMAALDDALRPLIEAVQAAPIERRVEAEAKLEALKEEAA